MLNAIKDVFAGVILLLFFIAFVGLCIWAVTVPPILFSCLLAFFALCWAFVRANDWY